VTAAGYDAVVVGGGLVGTALAYELAIAGARTALVDRHDHGRATDAGAGILSPESTSNAAPDDDRVESGRVHRLTRLGTRPAGASVRR
jgi:flavin-dependent dehydrogenase